MAFLTGLDRRVALLPPPPPAATEAWHKHEGPVKFLLAHYPGLLVVHFCL